MGFFSSIGNFFGDITGSNRSANAAQSGAELQYEAAQKAIDEQKSEFAQQINLLQSTRGEATSMAQMSPSELGQMGINLDLQNKALTSELAAIDRNNQMLDAADPAVKEAGKQALELLQGKQSSALQPVLDQRSRARSQLEQQLSDRLGPDYAQSSAGAAALRNFDNDTSTLTNNVQQQTLGTLLGVAQNTSMNLNPVNTASSVFSTLGSLNAYGTQAAQNVTNRTVNAFLGTPFISPPQINYNPMIQSADYSSVGALYKGQAQEQMLGPLTASFLPTKLNNSFQSALGSGLGMMAGGG